MTDAAGASVEELQKQAPKKRTKVSIDDAKLEQITKYLRSKTPTFDGTNDKRRVDYFKGKDIVEVLLKSKYKSVVNGSIDEACSLLTIMARKCYFVKAEVVKLPKDGDPRLKESSINVFRPDDSLYIWRIMDSPLRNIIVGTVILCGFFLVCMMSLWPNWMKVGVQYGSYAVLGLVGGLFGLMIFRAILFCVIQVCTLGRVFFWLYPNLNEDVDGIMDSFKPLYSIEYAGADEAKKNE